MTPADRTKFFEVLGGLHDFYGKELTKFAGQVWWQVCEAFDLEQVTKAFSAHLTDAEHGRFMPKPADLVRVLHGTRTDRSLIAWGKVLGAMQRVGAYTSVCFDDGLIHAAIEDLGGWIKVCRSTTDELPHVQRRFCDSYKAYTTRGDAVFPALLPGANHLDNATRGYANPKPTLIGDPEAAKRVFSLGTSAPRTRITSPALPVREAVRLIGGTQA